MGRKGRYSQEVEVGTDPLSPDPDPRVWSSNTDKSFLCLETPDVERKTSSLSFLLPRHLLFSYTTPLEGFLGVPHLLPPPPRCSSRDETRDLRRLDVSHSRRGWKVGGRGFVSGTIRVSPMFPLDPRGWDPDILGDSTFLPRVSSTGLDSTVVVEGRWKGRGPPSWAVPRTPVRRQFTAKLDPRLTRPQRGW